MQDDGFCEQMEMFDEPWHDFNSYFEYDEEEKNNLQLQLMEKLQEIDKRYQCVITMEHSYKAHV